ncbi:MAG: DNA recombination protein RmuC, partial [Acidobacteriaceae bacterium]
MPIPHPTKRKIKDITCMQSNLRLIFALNHFPSTIEREIGDGLQSDLHQNCRVMVAGPSNLYALLTSFQLGFRMLNLQKKGNEVWNVLAKTQTEFKTFETLMGSMENQVGT